MEKNHQPMTDLAAAYTALAAALEHERACVNAPNIPTNIRRWENAKEIVAEIREQIRTLVAELERAAATAK